MKGKTMDNGEKNDPTGVMHDPVTGTDALTEAVDAMEERVKASLLSGGAAEDADDRGAVVEPDDRVPD